MSLISNPCTQVDMTLISEQINEAFDLNGGDATMENSYMTKCHFTQRQPGILTHLGLVDSGKIQKFAQSSLKC